MTTGWAFTIDACPYVFTSGSITTLPTSASSNWPSNVSIASGFLALQDEGQSGTRIAWDEMMRPIDGDLEVGEMTFVLEDAPSGSIGNLCTQLFTRDDTSISTTILTATCLAGDTTITVANGSAFGTAPFQIWIEREAMLVTGISGSTWTVTRGYYGSRAVQHTVSDELGILPEVWSAFNWASFRRVCLWSVDASNVAFLEWSGYCQHARLHDDGAAFELQCTHAIVIERDCTFANPAAVCHLRGFNPMCLKLSVKLPNERYFFSGFDLTYFNTVGPSGTLETVSLAQAMGLVYDDLDTCINRSASCARNYLTNQITLGHINAINQCEGRVDGDGMHFYVSLNWEGFLPTTYNSMTVYMAVFNNVAFQGNPVNEQDTTNPSNTDPHDAEVVSTFIPTALVAMSSSGVFPVPVDTIANMPTSFSAVVHNDPSTGVTDPPYQTVVAPMLLGDLNDDVGMEFIVTGTSADDSNLQSGGPSVSGYVMPYPKTPRAFAYYSLGGPLVGFGSGLFFIDRPMALQYAVMVDSNHVGYALKYAIEDSTYLSGQCDPRNWDFSDAQMDTLTQATDAVTAARTYYFDGSQKVGEIIRDAGALHGFGIGLRSGLMTLVPFRRPLANENVVASLTADDMPAGMSPTWTELDDGIANIAEVDSDSVTIIVNELRSQGRYGAKRAIKIKLDGVPFDSTILQNPQSLAMTMLSRCLYLWNLPTEEGEIPVNLSRLIAADGNPIYQGDFVAVSDWLMPNRSGVGRGWSGRLGMVRGRRIDRESGSGSLNVLVLPVAVGYSPCVKVATVGLNYVDCATGYIDGVTDYSAGQDAVGGASFFASGHRVEVLKRNVTTYGASDHDSLIVDHVTGNRIYFTTNIPTSPTNWGTFVTGGGWADVRFDHFSTSGLTDDQKKWAWIGSRSARVIDGTTTQNQEWSP